jgi:glycosyltransferase involved in cell wall biosynthesis
MKVIQFIHTISSGGAEAVMLRLHEGFIEKGLEVKIAVFKKSNDFYRLPKDVDLLNINKNSLKAKRQIVSYLKSEKADLVLVHMCSLHSVFSKIDYPNIFLIVHLDIFYKYQHKTNFLKRMIFKRKISNTYNNHQTITVSNNIRESMLLNFKLDSSRIRTIHNPFDFATIRYKSEETIEIKEDYILHIGRFEAIKRHDILIEAFKNIENKNIKLVLLGEGALKDKIQTLVNKYNMGERVIFLGWQSNPFKYIKNAKAVVLSSDSEALPNVLIESLILHIPIVSTATLGAREILIDELRNYLSKVNDADDLAIKIDLALNSYPKIDNKYYAHFEINKVLEKYLRLIRY